MGTTPYNSGLWWGDLAKLSLKVPPTIPQGQTSTYRFVVSVGCALLPRLYHAVTLTRLRHVQRIIISSCRKTHLFDIDIPGKITFKESETLTAGSELTCLQTRFGRLGLGICYDLRFPEMAMIYRDRGADILVYPGAFNMATGPVHWRLLQQARALDNQLFVCSCAPARDEEFSYVAWGHSLVVGPFGEVLEELGHEEGVLFCEIDLEQIKQRRSGLPVGLQKRSDLYGLVDKCPKC